LQCDHCKADISGFKYKKTALAATTALIIGAGSVHIVDKYFLSETRYPLEVENAILDHCRNGHSSLIYQETQKKISQMCVCALSNTQKEISFSEVKKDKNKFLRKFDQQVDSCKA
jgi:hypothetical protein